MPELDPAKSDRRLKPRINCSYPATVTGHAENGERYKVPAVLSNLSSIGMYLRLKHPVQIGEAVFIATRLSTAPLGEASGPEIAAFAKVKRIEKLSDGNFGIAVEIIRHRFL